MHWDSDSTQPLNTPHNTSASLHLNHYSFFPILLKLHELHYSPPQVNLLHQFPCVYTISINPILISPNSLPLHRFCSSHPSPSLHLTPFPFLFPCICFPQVCPSIYSDHCDLALPLSLTTQADNSINISSTTITQTFKHFTICSHKPVTPKPGSLHRLVDNR